MVGCYRRVTAEELAALRDEPVALQAFLFPPGDLPPAVDRYFELGPWWQAIHFLLAGDPWAGGGTAAKAVLGGTPLSDEDFGGFGPARALDPEEVAAVAGALELLPAAEWLERFDPPAMNAAEVYPGNWSDDAATRRDLGEAYDGLRNLFASAAAQGDGMIFYLA